MNRGDFDFDLNNDFDPYSDPLSSGGSHDFGNGPHSGEVPAFEHPCLELKKMLGGGTFYYSVVGGYFLCLSLRPVSTPVPVRSCLTYPILILIKLQDCDLTNRLQDR